MLEFQQSAISNKFTVFCFSPFILIFIVGGSSGIVLGTARPDDYMMLPCTRISSCCSFFRCSSCLLEPGGPRESLAPCKDRFCVYFLSKSGSCLSVKFRVLGLFLRKSLMSAIFPPTILGPEMAFMGAWHLERKLNPNFFFSNFSGNFGISRQNPGISRQKSLISLVSRGIPNFLAPTPSCGRPPPHRKISGLKSLGLGSF